MDKEDFKNTLSLLYGEHADFEDYSVYKVEDKYGYVTYDGSINTEAIYKDIIPREKYAITSKNNIVCRGYSDEYYIETLDTTEITFMKVNKTIKISGCAKIYETPNDNFELIVVNENGTSRVYKVETGDKLGEYESDKIKNFGNTKYVVLALDLNNRVIAFDKDYGADAPEVILDKKGYEVEVIKHGKTKTYRVKSSDDIRMLNKYGQLY